MDWTIYSTGDGAFLAEVLNAVAMITNAGNIAWLASIGFIIGVIFVVVESIIKGGQSLNFGGMIFAAVLFVGFFGTTTKVTVFDMYTDAGRQVSHVPLGVAMTGTVLSHMGYAITKFTEQAYSIPGMLETGYGTPLEMILATRAETFKEANSLGEHDNFLQTLANYTKDCTIVGMDLGFLQPSKMVKNGDALDAVRFDSDLYTTKVFLGQEGGETLTCNEAYSAIEGEYGSYMTAWNHVLSKDYNVGDAETVIGDALGTMVDVGLDARQYMMNSLVSNVLQRVEGGQYSPGTFASTIISTQAHEQARVQFGGEASLWARFARPLMTFVEGFVYSMTPFMAFVLGFGFLGVKLVGRYLLMLLWVQLWMPILSVINLFIDMSFLKKMDALYGPIATGPSLDALSMLGMSRMQGEAADWVAVGGSLVAAAPALALAIVYGGAYTLVNVANRVSPQDTIDERQAAPNLMQNQGVLSMSQSSQHDLTKGLRQMNMDGNVASFDAASMASNEMSSASAERASASSAYMTSLRRGLSNAFSQGDGTSVAQALGSNWQSLQGTAFESTVNEARSWAKDHNLSDSQTETLMGTIEGVVSGGIDVPTGKSILRDAGISGGLSGRGAMKSSSSVDQKQSGSQRIDEMIKRAGSESSKRAYQEAITGSDNMDMSRSWNQVAQDQEGQDFSHSFGKMQEANESFQEAQSLRSSVGTKKSVDLLSMSESLANNQGWLNSARLDANMDPSIRQGIGQEMDRLQRMDPQAFGNEDRAFAAAFMNVASQHAYDNGTDPAAASSQRETLVKGLKVSNYFGSGSGLGDNFNPASNRGVSGNAASTGASGASNAGSMIGGQAGGSMANAHNAAMNNSQSRLDVEGSGEIQKEEAFDEGKKLFEDGKSGTFKEAVSAGFRQLNDGKGSNPSFTQKFAHGMEKMKASFGKGSNTFNQYKQLAEGVGLTDAQSNYYSQLSSEFMNGEADYRWNEYSMRSGRNLADVALDKRNIETSAHNAIYQEYLGVTNDPEKAKQYTQDTMKGIEKAAKAGKTGGANLQGLSMVNSALN